MSVLWPVAVTAYLLLNVVAFACYALDKYRARRAKRRIPEATLLLLAFIGGALGAWIAMYMFRHKTRHLRFVLLVPVLFLMHIALVYWILVGC